MAGPAGFLETTGEILGPEIIGWEAGGAPVAKEAGALMLAAGALKASASGAGAGGMPEGQEGVGPCGCPACAAGGNAAGVSRAGLADIGEGSGNSEGGSMGLVGNPQLDWTALCPNLS